VVSFPIAPSNIVMESFNQWFSDTLPFSKNRQLNDLKITREFHSIYFHDGIFAVFAVLASQRLWWTICWINMFVFSYFPISIISNGQQNRPHWSFIYFFQPKKSSCCCGQKQNRGHPSLKDPIHLQHRMLLSQAEKKVASMARELDALTAFERRSF